jgi:hypothetical protein
MKIQQSYPIPFRIEIFAYCRTTSRFGVWFCNDFDCIYEHYYIFSRQLLLDDVKFGGFTVTRQIPGATQLENNASGIYIVQVCIYLQFQYNFCLINESYGSFRHQIWTSWLDDTCQVSAEQINFSCFLKYKYSRLCNLKGYIHISILVATP